MTEADAFARIDEDELFAAYCVTAVVGLHLEEVGLSRLWFDTAHRRFDMPSPSA